ncbi:hypothetical protein DESC_660122 [Desulfosarcina cetonica]|uniref:hypothetical protein n=1 Tax=Desulfosarcina cetonica TaxID=90730 RepID=UPI0006D07A73|nr:hypothetical protein [Desulfosarcina cetonica]VTR67995.1 hypothetical protein DESC_660122 [Desulfosarcina cetonica]
MNQQQSNKPAAKPPVQPSLVYVFTVDETQPSLHSTIFMRLWTFHGRPRGYVPIQTIRKDEQWS